MGVCCAVYGCLSSTNDKTKRKFYRFPLDESRCRQWLRAAGRTDLESKDTKTLHNSYRICDLHFVSSDHLKRNIKYNAVPSLNLPQLENGDKLSKYTQTDVESKCCTPSSSKDTVVCTRTVQELSYNTPRKRKLREDPKRDQEGVVQNTGVLCKNCQNVIVGFRYKCITCEDYDLCKNCEMLETHSEHYVLRIPKPLKPKEAEDIAQKLQQMFEPDDDEGIPPIDIKEEDPIGINTWECGDDEPIQDDNSDEDVHSTEQFKNITHNEASRVIDKSEEVREPTGTVRRKRKRTGERETVGDDKRMRDAHANAAKELADANSDSDSGDSYIELEIKEEICEESEVISRVDVGETVNPYAKENHL